MNIEEFIGNADAKKDGVWLTYEDDDDDPKGEFKLAFWESPVPRTWYAKQLRLATGSGRRVPPPEVMNDLAVQMMNKHLLKGWRHVKANQEPLEFTADNVKLFLVNSPTILDWLCDQARQIKNFGDAATTEGDSAVAAIKSEPAVAA